MGCTASTQKKCRRSKNHFSPMQRSSTVNVHHPAQHRGDSYHVVSLTSTTLGSLILDSTNRRDKEFDSINLIPKGFDEKSLNPEEEAEKEEGGGGDDDDDDDDEQRKAEFCVRLTEAKAWSTMIEEKIPKIIPKTPITTPPGEPETINTWELMHDLEEQFTTTTHLRSPTHPRSFSFEIIKPAPCIPFDRPSSRFKQPDPIPLTKPIWLQIADNDPISTQLITEFDPDIITTFRKSLQDQSILQEQKTQSFSDQKPIVVVYFTSLRGIRKTYEDCCNVRVILKSLGVRIDERDVSMHSGFKEELRELMGCEYNASGLPRVFIGTNHIGGADEIRRMNEDGKLEKLIEGCEMADDDFGGGVNGGGTCGACGDVRFLPCETCSGSCKVFYEEDEETGEETEEGEYGFRRCVDCNENGLVRCPICCY